MMHMVCRYISSLFKQVIRGDILYFMCVCTDEERENALGAFQSRAVHLLIAASFAC